MTPEMFKCDTLNASLTVSACGRRYLRGEDALITADGVAPSDMSYMPCRGCATGKVNSEHARPLSPRALTSHGRRKDRIHY